MNLLHSQLVYGNSDEMRWDEMVYARSTSRSVKTLSWSLAQCTYSAYKNNRSCHLGVQSQAHARKTLSDRTSLRAVSIGGTKRARWSSRGSPGVIRAGCSSDLVTVYTCSGASLRSTAWFMERNILEFDYLFFWIYMRYIRTINLIMYVPRVIIYIYGLIILDTTYWKIHACKTTFCPYLIEGQGWTKSRTGAVVSLGFRVLGMIDLLVSIDFVLFGKKFLPFWMFDL